MRIMIFTGKVLIATSLVVAALAVAAIAPLGRQNSVAAAPREKDQSRVPSAPAPEGTAGYASNLVQLAQAVKPRPPGQPALIVADEGELFGSPPPGFERPVADPRENAGQDLSARPARIGGRRPGPPPVMAMQPDRRLCSDQIDHGAGVAGYFKSKLNLQGAQKDAWLKIEEAAEPVVQKMRQFCAGLPAEPGARPSFPTVIEMTDKQFALRAEFVSAVIGPAKALYDLLSPDQRAILDRPLPPLL
jgi:hypothetical protein